MADDAANCAACGREVLRPPPSPGKGSEPFAQVLSDTERAAKQLALGAARISKKAVERARDIVDDPKGSTKKVLERLDRELDQVRADLEKAIREI